MTDLVGGGLCSAALRLGDGVLALLTADLSLEVLSDGELGIDSAPDLVSVAASTSSVSVSDHASPADRTDFVFLPRGRPRENALLSELFSCNRHTHSLTHSFIHSFIQPVSQSVIQSLIRSLLL